MVETLTSQAQIEYALFCASSGGFECSDFTFQDGDFSLAAPAIFIRWDSTTALCVGVLPSSTPDRLVRAEKTGGDKGDGRNDADDSAQGVAITSTPTSTPRDEFMSLCYCREAVDKYDACPSPDAGEWKLSQPAGESSCKETCNLLIDLENDKFYAPSETALARLTDKKEVAKALFCATDGDVTCSDRPVVYQGAPGIFTTELPTGTRNTTCVALGKDAPVKHADGSDDNFQPLCYCRYFGGGRGDQDDAFDNFDEEDASSTITTRTSASTSTFTTTTVVKVCQVYLTPITYEDGDRNADCVGSDAFYNYQGNVDLSDFRLLTHIEARAFFQMAGSVTIVDTNSPLVDIGAEAFGDMNGELTIDIQAPNLKHIHDSSFYNPEKFARSSIRLSNLMSLLRIGSKALSQFGGYLKIESSAPSLVVIGDEAFSRTKEGHVYLSEMDSLAEIGEYAFYCSPSFTDFISYELHGGKAMTKKIGNMAFPTDFIPDAASTVNFELIHTTSLKPEDFHGSSLSDNRTYAYAIKNLTISGLANLVSIESSTFDAFEGTLTLSGEAPRLKRVGKSAFENMISQNFERSKASSISLNSLSELKVVDEKAFYGFLGKITLSGKVNKLTIVGDEAFASDRRAAMDRRFELRAGSSISFEGLANLERVGKRAFGGGYEPNCGYKGYLNFTGSPSKMSIIDEYAFARLSSASTIALTGLRRLEEIHERAFSETQAKIEISGEVKNLAILGESAFGTCISSTVNRCEGDPNLDITLLKVPHKLRRDDVEDGTSLDAEIVMESAFGGSWVGRKEIRYLLDLVALGDGIYNSELKEFEYKACNTDLWSQNPSYAGISQSCRKNKPTNGEYYDLYDPKTIETNPMRYNSVYKISPLQIDKERTAVGPGGGTVDDLTFQIGDGRPKVLFGDNAPDWLFLNPSSGVVMLELKEGFLDKTDGLDANTPTDVAFRLLVADKVGTTAVLETYAITINPVPQFTLNVGDKRALHGVAINKVTDADDAANVTGNGILYTDPDNRASGYYTFQMHETYTIKPRNILPSSEYTSGTADDLVFSLKEIKPEEWENDPEVTDFWYMNPKTGEMLARFYPWIQRGGDNKADIDNQTLNTRNYTVQLWVTDGGGLAEKLVETMYFPVTYWDTDMPSLLPIPPERIGLEELIGNIQCQHGGRPTEQVADCSTECERCLHIGNCDRKLESSDVFKGCSTCLPLDDARRYDRAENNDTLTIQCDCTDEWTGTNCQHNVAEAKAEADAASLEASEAKAAATAATITTGVGAGVGGLIGVAAAVFLATKYSMYRDSIKPADFNKMLELLIKNGELSLEQLGQGSGAAAAVGADRGGGGEYSGAERKEATPDMKLTLQSDVFKDVGLILDEGADIHGDYISVTNTTEIESSQNTGYVLPAAKGARPAQHQYAADSPFDSVAEYIIPDSQATKKNPIYQEEGEEVLGFANL
eukprot:gene8133-2554_t